MMLADVLKLLLAVATAGGSWSAGAGAVPPGIVSRQAAQAPTIDGRLDEAAWRSAETVDHFFQHNTAGPARMASVAYLMHDDRALYVGMIMRKAFGETVKGRIGSDSVEIFVDPGRSRVDCFQMVFALEKALAIAHVKGGSDPEWESGAEWAGRELAVGWVLEVAIPFAKLGAQPPAAGETWGLLLCRNDVHHGRATLAPIRGAYRQPPLFCSVTFDAAPVRPPSPDEPPQPPFAALVGAKRAEATALAAGNPARETLLERLADLTKMGEAAEADALSQAMVAPLIRRWAWDSAGRILEDDIDWRLKLGRLLFRKE